MIAGIVAWAVIAVVVLFVWLGKKMMDKAAHQVPVYDKRVSFMRERKSHDYFVPAYATSDCSPSHHASCSVD